MTNDMIPDVPGGPAALFKEKNLLVEQLGEGVESSGFPVIGINGKTLYVRYKGERHTLPDLTPRTDGETPPAQYFDFVVLRQGQRVSHTWYKDGYQKGSSESPDCHSTDGLAPDDDSPDKQSDLCQLCPQHEWKMQPNGREGRACTDRLHLAILPMPKMIEAAMGEPITQPTMFRIPAASLKAFAAFGGQMVKRYGGNSPICSYVIRAKFDDSVSYPRFDYRLVRWLNDEEAVQILELRDDPLAWRILGLTPEGNSLVRRGTVKPVNLGDAQPTRAAVGDHTADRLAAERAERIAAVRGGGPKQVQIEARAEEITVRPVSPATKPVDDTADDIDALVAAMRPQPPR